MSFVMPTSPLHPSKSVAVPLQRLLRYNIHAKGAKGVQPEETGVNVRSPRCWVLGGKIPFRLPNPPLLPLPGKSRKLLETHDRMTANPNCSAVPRVPATSLPGRPHPTFLDPGSCVGVVWQRHGRGGGSSISFLGGWGGGCPGYHLQSADGGKAPASTPSLQEGPWRSGVGRWHCSPGPRCCKSRGKELEPRQADGLSERLGDNSIRRPER